MGTVQLLGFGDVWLNAGEARTFTASPQLMLAAPFQLVLGPTHALETVEVVDLKIGMNLPFCSPAPVPCSLFSANAFCPNELHTPPLPPGGLVSLTLRNLGPCAVQLSATLISKGRNCLEENPGDLEPFDSCVDWDSLTPAGDDFQFTPKLPRRYSGLVNRRALHPEQYRRPLTHEELAEALRRRDRAHPFPEPSTYAGPDAWREYYQAIAEWQQHPSSPSTRVRERPPEPVSAPIAAQPTIVPPPAPAPAPAPPVANICESRGPDFGEARQRPAGP